MTELVPLGASPTGDVVTLELLWREFDVRLFLPPVYCYY